MTDDSFGDSDSRKMPGHFFSGALSIDHDGAVRAETGNQNFSVCPRYGYVDADFTCENCGREFTWTAAEQRAWFEDYFFWVDSCPRHCQSCRADRRRLSELRKEYDATIDEARRSRADAPCKRRIIEIVSELQGALGTMPEKMIETKQRFENESTGRNKD